MEDGVINSVTVQQVSPCWLKSCKREKRGCTRLCEQLISLGLETMQNSSWVWQ